MKLKRAGRPETAGAERRIPAGAGARPEEGPACATHQVRQKSNRRGPGRQQRYAAARAAGGHSTTTRVTSSS